MTHRVISLRYRPQDFDELTGQSHITRSLKGAVKSGRIGHAFLFAGPRGVGKTTTARILAKSLNCNEGANIHPCQKCQSCKEITLSRNLDVIEIDGASNRGIDEIRNLREGVRYSPLHGRYKIYIIDEVHMLTQEAFNALLKTLEEPPPKVIFIFATTNPMKVPTTILSRCQRFVFKRLSIKEISSRLGAIAEQENIKITPNALHYLAVRADGSIRDGESILEQLTSFVDGEVTEKDVFKLIGFLGSSFYIKLLKHMLAQDLKQVIELFNEGIEDGADPIEIYRGFTSYLRAIFLAKTGLPEEFIELSKDEVAASQDIQLDRERLIMMLETCIGFEEIVRRSVNIRVVMELLLSRLVLNMCGSDESAHVKKAEKSKANPGNKTSLKEQLSKKLQSSSPKLAGVVHDADLKKEGKNIIISAKNDFSKRQLEKNKETLEKTLKELLKEDFELTIDITVQKKEKNDFVETIKTMFDSEEIR
ncbi:MAG: DNA polymerase III subunit gamma/tau [bacterium]